MAFPVVPLVIVAIAGAALFGGGKGGGGDPTITVARVVIPPAPSGWRNHIKDDGPAAAAACVEIADTLDDVRTCTAEALFPDDDWPVTDDSPDWQYDAWQEINALAHDALGLEPPPVG